MPQTTQTFKNFQKIGMRNKVAVSSVIVGDRNLGEVEVEEVRNSGNHTR